MFSTTCPSSWKTVDMLAETLRSLRLLVPPSYAGPLPLMRPRAATGFSHTYQLFPTIRHSSDPFLSFRPSGARGEISVRLSFLLTASFKRHDSGPRVSFPQLSSPKRHDSGRIVSFPILPWPGGVPGDGGGPKSCRAPSKMAFFDGGGPNAGPPPSPRRRGCG